MAPNFLKTKAFVVFSGTASGGVISFQLPEIGYTGHSIGALSPPMNAGTQSAEATLSYISVDRLQSGITFATAAMSAGKVKIFFVYNGVIVGVLTSEGGDDEEDVNMLNIPPTTANIQFRSSSNARSTQDILLDIQKLGGSAGYEKHISSLGSFNAQSISLPDVTKWPAVSASLSYTSIVIHSTLTVKTADHHSGSGSCWGPGIGSGTLYGQLNYSSWSKILSEENDFYVVSGGTNVGGATMVFLIKGEVVATFIGIGQAMGGLVGINGTFKWDQ